jgi:hypothetical protein
VEPHSWLRMAAESTGAGQDEEWASTGFLSARRGVGRLRLRCGLPFDRASLDRQLANRSIIALAYGWTR